MLKKECEKCLMEENGWCADYEGDFPCIFELGKLAIIDDTPKKDICHFKGDAFLR